MTRISENAQDSPSAGSVAGRLGFRFLAVGVSSLVVALVGMLLSNQGIGNVAIIVSMTIVAVVACIAMKDSPIVGFATWAAHAQARAWASEEKLEAHLEPHDSKFASLREECGHLRQQKEAYQRMQLISQLTLEGIKPCAKNNIELLKTVLEGLRGAATARAPWGDVLEMMRDLKIKLPNFREMQRFNELPINSIVQSFHSTLISLFGKTARSPANDVNLIAILFKKVEIDGKKYLKRCAQPQEMDGELTPITDSMNEPYPISEPYETPETLLLKLDHSYLTSNVDEDRSASGAMYSNWPPTRAREAIQSVFCLPIRDPLTNDIAAVLSLYGDQPHLFDEQQPYLKEFVLPAAEAFGLLLQLECLRLEVHRELAARAENGTESVEGGKTLPEGE